MYQELERTRAAIVLLSKPSVLVTRVVPVAIAAVVCFNSKSLKPNPDIYSSTSVQRYRRFQPIMPHFHRVEVSSTPIPD